MFDPGHISLGGVIGQRGLSAARELVTPPANDANFGFEFAEYLSSCGSGHKLLVNHLVADSLNGVDDEGACDLQRSFDLNNLGFKVGNPFALGAHISLRAGLDNHTIAEGRSESIDPAGGRP
jgi:hypothetical protein